MIRAATKLLDDFRALPGRVERPRTFMEIAGYPHYENVCSNILAFFMDPEESHGLGTLVLDALASAGNIAAADEGVGGNASVEREVITDAGNRIDLLIESDTLTILIENKIYAGASNPFDDYAAYLDRRIDDGRAKHKLLLTVFPINESSKWGFTNLTYERLVEQIRSLLGRYVSHADARYLTMFLDFLNTIENLRRETRMNPEFVKLLSERGEDVENLLTEVETFKDEMRKKIQELTDFIEVGEYQNVHQWSWRKGTGLQDSLIHDIKVSEDLPVAIITAVSPQGWWIDIFVRRGGDGSKLRDLLESLEILFEEGWPLTHSDYRFAYGENLDNIKPVLKDLVNKVATSQDRQTDKDTATHHEVAR